MERVNWGIIGCGTVTEKKSGPAFNKVDNSRLVAVMRRDREKVVDYARRHHVPKWYTSAEALIRDPEVNAVYIATPPQTHARYAIAAMRAGKPVYVEKPMARTYSECLEMINISKETVMPLYVAYYRRKLPGFLKLKEWIETGKAGTVRMVLLRLILPPRPEDMNPEHLPWRVIPEIAGAGYFYDLASHQLDILDYIFGPIKTVQSYVTNFARLYPAEDTVVANFTFNSGMLGQGIWNFSAFGKDPTDTIDIYGSEGSIHFSTYRIIPVTLINKEGKTEYRFTNPENIQFNLIRSVVGELQGKGKCPSTGITAARTNRVLEEIIKPYYNIPG